MEACSSSFRNKYIEAINKQVNNSEKEYRGIARFD